jgi:hypothetical protein
MRRFLQQLRQFRAGWVAARRQLFVVLTFSWISLILRRLGLVEPLVDVSDANFSASAFLQWGFLIFGMNSALMRGPVYSETAAFIRTAAHRLRPIAPRPIIAEASALFWLGAGCSAVIALMSPPHILATLISNRLFLMTIVIAWPAMATIVMAYFIANGLAVRRLA